MPARTRIPGVVIAAAIGLAVAAFAQSLLPDISVSVNGTGVVATDSSGHEAWRFAFPKGTVVSELGQRSALLPGNDPAVYALTSHSEPVAGEITGGQLFALDRAGRLLRQFSFSDRVRFRGSIFGTPWAMATFAAAADGRVAVSSHHWLWEPSPVTVLDRRFARSATFVHAGWVESLNWLAPDRLLIGGFSEPRDGGMVALLDPAAMNGQGPEDPGTKFYCEDCGPDRPLRMVIMPRSELNLATRSRFNRAVIEVLPDRIVARTAEIPALAPGDRLSEAIYEFSRSLELRSARFSDNYLEAHRSLEAAGKLDHTLANCPDRRGPRLVLTWNPTSGWREQRINSAR